MNLDANRYKLMSNLKVVCQTVCNNNHNNHSKKEKTVTRRINDIVKFIFRIVPDCKLAQFIGCMSELFRE